MNNKQKIIKSGFFTFSSVLFLVVATVAWFVSGDKVNSEDIKGDIDLGSYSAAFFESIDLNKNGVHDEATEPWVEAFDVNLDIMEMVPGEKHFYKIEVTALQPSINFLLNFKSVTATYPSGYTQLQKDDALGRINVAFAAKNKDDVPIAGTSINKNLLSFFGKTDPLLTDTFDIYNNLILSNDVNENPIKIYYTIGIDGGNDDHGDDILENIQVDIGTINLSATVNP